MLRWSLTGILVLMLLALPMVTAIYLRAAWFETVTRDVAATTGDLAARSGHLSDAEIETIFGVGNEMLDMVGSRRVDTMTLASLKAGNDTFDTQWLEDTRYPVGHAPSTPFHDVPSNIARGGDTLILSEVTLSYSTLGRRRQVSARIYLRPRYTNDVVRVP